MSLWTDLPVKTRQAEFWVPNFLSLHGNCFDNNAPFTRMQHTTLLLVHTPHLEVTLRKLSQSAANRTGFILVGSGTGKIVRGGVISETEHRFLYGRRGRNRTRFQLFSSCIALVKHLVNIVTWQTKTQRGV